MNNADVFASERLGHPGAEVRPGLGNGERLQKVNLASGRERASDLIRVNEPFVSRPNVRYGYRFQPFGCFGAGNAACLRGLKCLQSDDVQTCGYLPFVDMLGMAGGGNL